MKTTLLITSVAIAGLAGCAHVRGSVAMKTAEDEAHVCLDKGEVKTGDRVTLFRNFCVPKGGRSGLSGSTGGTTASAYCEKRELGQGTVKEILNDHYSVVKFDPGVQFDEKTFVEKR